MMKRALCIALSLMLLLGTACAEQLKVFSYSIPKLIGRQLQTNTSLRVKISAENAGSAPEGVDAQLWESMKEALPQLLLSGTYMRRKTSGDLQITAQLAQNGDMLTGLTLTGIEQDLLLETDLLPQIMLAMPREINSIFQLLTMPQEGEWPSLWRMVSAVESAGDEYAAALDELLKPHLNNLNDWLRDYTDMYMASAAPVQVVRVPVEAIKARIKVQLRALYADEALLTLLREVMLEEDEQVYLESGMLPLYETAIDNLSLAGEIVIERRYDTTGLLKEEKINLPFARGTGLKLISYEKSSENGLKVNFETESGLALYLTAAENAGSWQGEATVAIAGATVFSAKYALSIQLGQETYDAEQKNKERRQSHQAVLTLEPANGMTFSKQQITVTVDLIAGASNTSAAYCNVTLAWQDLQSDSAFTVRVQNNTSAPLKISEKDAGNAVRLENLSVQDLREWLGDTANSVANGLKELWEKCLELQK